MMDAISQTLGTEQGMQLIERPKAYESDTASDVSKARENLKELIEQSMEQVPTMLDNMSSSQDSKMYSAAAQFLAVLTEMNNKLSKINSPNKPSVSKTSPVSISPGQPVTQNNVYIGTTEDLLRMMSQQSKSIEPLECIEATSVAR